MEGLKGNLYLEQIYESCNREVCFKTKMKGLYPKKTIYITKTLEWNFNEVSYAPSSFLPTVISFSVNDY